MVLTRDCYLLNMIYMFRLWLFLAFFALFSCFGRSRFLPLPETPLTLPGGGYGVVNTPYLRLSSTMGDLGNQVATLRVGDIVQIQEIRTIYDKSRQIWMDYYFVVTEDKVFGWSSSEFIEKFKYKKTAQEYQKTLQNKRENIISE